MTEHTQPAHAQAAAEAAVTGSTDEQKKMSTGKKALLILGAVVLVLLLVVYGAGAVFFSSHFYPNTRFNAQDISFQADTEFVSEVEALVPSYQLTITGDGYEQVLTSEQIEFGVDPDRVRTDALASQNIWLWPIEAFFDHDISDAIHAYFNHRKVSDIITPTVTEYNKTANVSVDATIGYNEVFNTVVVQDEVYGNQLDLDAFLGKIDEALTGMETTYIIDGEACIQPAILSDDERFTAALPAAQTIVGGDIDLTMAEGAVSAGKVSKELLVSWLTLDPETLMPLLDEALVTAWADQKSAELNTVGTTRKYTRPDGKKVTVGGGVYGWRVNTADLASTIIANATAGNFEAIDIPCEQTSDIYNGPGGRDWGAYVDIDLSEQKVRYFNENDEELFITDCVTGNISNGHGTPTGLYYLRMKKSPETLTGLNADGSTDYETKVTYWLPFIRNSIGLHDASWRGNFGGSIYKTNGSHGCVNLPTSAAKWFYDNLETNVAVIVHE
ncbi:L,D-transpeptidase family protein [Anaerotardibacter muris]|uniref:L,D-transpeptidase family protein n=1 Tax=Anaerotardibacter muris TaxID=2941505 RepID=UPI00203FE017|nr:L,D-transpeptidase family protein [Anaerotardibacter muris]